MGSSTSVASSGCSRALSRSLASMGIPKCRPSTGRCQSKTTRLPSPTSAERWCLLRRARIREPPRFVGGKHHIFRNKITTIQLTCDKLEVPVNFQVFYTVFQEIELLVGVLTYLYLLPVVLVSMCFYPSVCMEPYI